MINLSRMIEEAIKSASRNALLLNEGEGDLLGIIKLLTTNDDDLDTFEVLYIPDDQLEQWKYVCIYGDDDDRRVFFIERGVACSKEDTEAFKTAIRLHLIDNTASQLILDKILADKLRETFYPDVIRHIQKNAYKAKMVEVAEKPRNKNYDAAMAMLRRTWERYPGASKKALFKAIRNEFNGGVSEDSLRRWTNAAGLGPEQSAKRTSFSLVRD